MSQSRWRWEASTFPTMSSVYLPPDAAALAIKVSQSFSKTPLTHSTPGEGSQKRGSFRRSNGVSSIKQVPIIFYAPFVFQLSILYELSHTALIGSKVLGLKRYPALACGASKFLCKI